MAVTYEYCCDDCFHQFEKEQRITDAPLTECPLCHQLAVHRLISGGSGVVFQGGGWARDLYSKQPEGQGDGT